MLVYAKGWDDVYRFVTNVSSTCPLTVDQRSSLPFTARITVAIRFKNMVLRSDVKGLPVFAH